MPMQRWRRVWLVVVGLPVVITLASWPATFALLREACDGCLVTLDLARALQSVGLSVTLWAIWNLVIASLALLCWTGVGVLIYWRSRDNVGVLFMSALLALMGPGFGGFLLVLGLYQPQWWLISRIIQLLSTTSLFFLVLVLPTGRIAPRWTVWPVLYLIALNTVNQLWPRSLAAFGRWPLSLNLALFFAPLLASQIVIPAYRYRRLLTPSERQQMKWVLVGIAAFVAWVAVLVSMAVTCQNTPGSAQVLRCAVIQNTGLSLASLTIPIFIGVAILRAHLWDIDLIIRRTLVYALLTGLLALAYFISVIVLQSIFGALTGPLREPSTLVTVLSTLVSAVLVVPLRRWVQAVIDRRFYRRKYDATRTLAAFGASVRDQVDMEALIEHLLGVVDETMQPASVSIWLSGGKRER